ncbi:MAG TPA: hypothetical protein VGE52_09905, partial [Pirellulales bacterium]
GAEKSQDSVPVEDRRNRVFAALVLAHFAWAILMFLAWEFGDARMRAGAGSLGFGGLAAQAMLLNLWNVLHEWSGWPRIQAFLIAGLAWGGVYWGGAATLHAIDSAVWSPSFSALVLGQLWIVCWMLATVANAWDWHWADENESPGVMIQFSVMRAAVFLGFFTVVFLTLWLSGGREGHETGTPLTVLAFVVLAALSVVSTVTGVIAAWFRTIVRWIAFAANVAGSFVIGGTAAYLLGSTHATEYDALMTGAASATFAALVSGSLIALRSAGWRIDRDPVVPFTSPRNAPQRKTLSLAKPTGPAR